MSKKLTFTLTSILLALIIAVSCVLISKQQVDVSTEALATRTVTLERQEINYESILNEFENAKLEKQGSLTTFEGYKTINVEDLTEFDNLSESELQHAEDSSVKYNFSYDSETNIVTISAQMKNELGEIELDEITGIGFINENNEIDAVMNVDGESILLSEMKELGMIQNCGWFSRLIKKVVKIAVVAVTVVAVAAVTAAVCVATAGAAAPALVAAGVGVTTSACLGAAAGVATAGLFALTVGAAAIQAGTAIAEPLGEGAEQIVDKLTGALLEIVYKGVTYASTILTAAIAEKLAKDAYFMALANPNDGAMYYCANPISKDMAISIMAANTSVSVYTYYEKNARSITQQAGNNMSPIWERHHNYGYFDHYHLGNLSLRGETHSDCYSHAFFGLPQFN